MVEWRPVVGWEGRYEVSDVGQVRSVARVVTVAATGRSWLQPSRVLLPYRTSSVGYPTLRLKAEGRKSSKRVHVMVLEAFVGPRPKGMVGCHVDGDPDNNTPSNLRWDTQSANQLHSIAHGTHHNTVKTHCKRGHEFSPENTYLNPTSHGRQCRACMREARAKWQSNR